MQASRDLASAQSGDLFVSFLLQIPTPASLTLNDFASLWLDSLGLPAQLPPPEEEQDVSSMEEAARARNTRQPDRDR